MGTGTGYIAVYLAKCGFSVDAVDISGKALEAAACNARLNDVSVNVFFSSLFENVKDEYDLIVFNPPVNPGEGKIFRWAGSLIRKSDLLVHLTLPVVNRIFGNKRLDLILSFIRQAGNHLKAGGSLLLSLFSPEITSLERRVEGIKTVRLESLGDIPDLHIVSIQLLK